MDGHQDLGANVHRRFRRLLMEHVDVRPVLAVGATLQQREIEGTEARTDLLEGG